MSWQEKEPARADDGAHRGSSSSRFDADRGQGAPGSFLSAETLAFFGATLSPETKRAMDPLDDASASCPLRIDPKRSGLPFALTLDKPVRYVASFGGPPPQLLSVSGPPGGPDNLRIYLASAGCDHDGLAALRKQLGERPRNETLAQTGGFDVADGSYPYLLYLTPDYAGPGRGALASLWIAIEPIAGRGVVAVNRELYASTRGVDRFAECELLRSIRVEPFDDAGGPA